MRIRSDTLVDGTAKSADHALAVADDPGPVRFSDNRNPHLAWSDAPPGTRSYVITCIDHDCPSAPDDVNRDDREVPADLPRIDFTHWLLVDVPASITEIGEGTHSDGVTPRGKQPADAPVGMHGQNDYTAWFAGDPDMGGTWHGYDGAAPPWNDSIRHRYEFCVRAIDVPTLGLAAGFTRADLDVALEGHVLASASITVTYSTNPRLS
jgi:Raf kinase inhibitor-like YbhB/YbcL family protein